MYVVSEPSNLQRFSRWFQGSVAHFHKPHHHKKTQEQISTWNLQDSFYYMSLNQDISKIVFPQPSREQEDFMPVDKLKHLPDPRSLTPIPTRHVRNTQQYLPDIKTAYQ